MPRLQDEEFVRFAVASGALSKEQGDEALRALREIEELGGSATAPQMLVKRGLLDERQVGLVHQAIATSKATVTVPKELGGFELLEKIGQGGMGTVFKARQRELDRIVALKLLSPRLARNKAFVERFFREARAAGRLSHPNIVAAIDVGEDQGFYYFAMEYVEGQTLTRVLASEGPLPEARALAAAAGVARALDHAHKKDLIHRDIKPDNIMVTPDGRVRVTDFGLAKALGLGADADDPSRFLGTPAYVAPEQLRSDPEIDCRADIFSLGVTLFQMLTAELPFKGANPMAIAAAVASDPLPFVRQLRPDVSIGTVRILEKMTAKDRAHRYATPADVVAALEARAAAPRPAPKPPGLPGAKAPLRRERAAERRRSRLGTLVTVLVIVGGNVAIFFGITHKLLNRRRNRAITPPPIEQTISQPTTETPVAKPDAELVRKALLEKLNAAMAAAVGFARRNPSAYNTQIARLEKILTDFPPEQRRDLPPAGRDLIVKTRTEIRRLEGEREKALGAELRARTRQADAFMGEGKINEAVRLFDTLPGELRTSAAMTDLGKHRATYENRAIAHFDALDTKAKQLVEQGNYDQAKAIYSGFTQCVVPKIASRARSALAAIDSRLAKDSAEALRVARAAYHESAVAILDRLADRDYTEARKLADAAVVDPKLAPLRDTLRGLQHLVRTVAEVWAHVGIAVKKLKPGEPLRIGGLAGEFDRLEGELIYLNFGSVSSARRLSKLRTAEVADLALRGYGNPSPQTDAKLGLFLLAERDYEAARTRIEAARAQGANTAQELDLLARFARQPCPNCKGAKELQCPACAGKGIGATRRMDCPTCNGRGSGRCTKCGGDGRDRCDNCGGTGRIGLGGLVCMVCNGRGSERCKRCGGDGIAKCRKCNATGSITTTTPCPKCNGTKTIPCPTCKGEGSLPAPDLIPPGKDQARKRRQ